MAEDTDFKIKGAATRSSSSPSPTLEQELEEGEINKNEPLTSSEPAVAGNEHMAANHDGVHGATGHAYENSATSEYRWCQRFCEPMVEGGQNYYFMHFDGKDSIWTEPTEPYWVWDESTGAVHACGLQIPRGAQAGVTNATISATADYQGYNPAIHGNYDPTAPYAKFHEQALSSSSAAEAPAAADVYQAIGGFNRFTGAYQTGDKSAERHNDANKSGRQMNAFFDVEAAANDHGGKSLKQERIDNKPRGSQLKKMIRKKKNKKDEKLLKFYKS